MKRSAQNVVEISLLLTLVVVVTVGVLFFMNQQKQNLASISTLPVNQQESQGGAVDNSNPSGSGNLGFSVESAGSLSNILGYDISVKELNEEAIDLSISDINETAISGKDIIDTANELINSLGLDMKPLTKNAVTKQTLADLVKVATDAEAKAPAGPNLANFELFVRQLKMLLD